MDHTNSLENDEAGRTNEDRDYAQPRDASHHDQGCDTCADEKCGERLKTNRGGYLMVVLQTPDTYDQGQ